MGARHISYKSICANCIFPSLESRIMPPSDDDTNKHLKQLYVQQTELQGWNPTTENRKTVQSWRICWGWWGAQFSSFGLKPVKHYRTKNSKKFWGKYCAQMTVSFDSEGVVDICGLCVKYWIISLIPNWKLKSPCVFNAQQSKLDVVSNMYWYVSLVLLIRENFLKGSVFLLFWPLGFGFGFACGTAIALAKWQVSLLDLKYFENHEDSDSKL